MPVSYTPIPYPQPTPYQSPSQGGNPYVAPGTIGTSIPQSWQPVYGPQPQGQTQWNSGAVTSTGGGTLYQSPTNYNPAPYSGSTGGQVAGASTDNSGGGNNSSSGGGGGPSDSRLQQLAKMDRNPVQEQEYQQLLASMQTGPSDAELNAAYNPIFDYLNQAESGVRNLYNQQNALYDTQAANRKSELATERNTANTKIAQQKSDAQQRKEDVITSSRRLYNELGMANRQRFGGATSAGQAASELQNVEFQRANASNEKSYQSTLREIGNQEMEVQSQYTLGLNRINEQLDQAKQSLYSDFQNNLLEISRQRASTEAEKASRKLNYLEQYRNQLFQLEVARQQSLQELDIWKQQQDYALAMYKQQLGASTAASGNSLTSYVNNTTTNPTSNYAALSQGTRQVSPITGYKSNDELQGFAPGIYDRNGNQIGSSYGVYQY